MTSLVNEKKQLPSIKEYEVVAQGNDLIRHVRFQLTALEQNIIYFCISKIKPEDTDLLDQTFTIDEFCKVCGISTDTKGPGGNVYRRIKAAMKSVRDKSAWVEFNDGTEVLVSWFDTIVIKKGSGEITVSMSKSVKPYLVGLIERARAGGEGYTQAHLVTFISLQSKYGKRLYEILKSYLHVADTQEKIYKQQVVEYSVGEFKQLLNAENYLRHQDFRRKVVEVAVREVNTVTDVYVTYHFIKSNRKISYIQFVFQHKKPTDRLEAQKNALGRLGRGKA